MKFIIEPVVLEKVRFFVDRCSYECSGLGKVLVRDKQIVATSCVLLKQKGNGTETLLDQDAVAAALYELRDVPGDLKWHWHSHVNMDTLASGTDRELMERFSQAGWVVASIFNKKGEVHSYYASQDPVFLMVDVPTSYRHEPTEKELKEWESEYKRLVSYQSNVDSSGLGLTARERMEWHSGYGYYNQGYQGPDRTTKAPTQKEKSDSVWASSPMMASYFGMFHYGAPIEWGYGGYKDPEDFEMQKDILKEARNESND